MQTIIIGKRSNLSQHLLSAIDGAVSISASQATSELASLNWQQSDKVNLILNQFQPAAKLNDLSSPIDYVDNAILSTAKILSSIQSRVAQINKIIYTSSSSVYGNNPSCKETDVPAPISLHATLKLANEKMVSSFCESHAIDYSIARVFNMYAGKDQFSIISKIILAAKQDQVINLINQGGAIRDFIHIDDVVYAYQVLLSVSQTKIVNIASGQGKSVRSILDYLKQNDIIVSTHNIERDEIDMSIADNTTLLNLIDKPRFRLVEEYVLNELRT